MTTLRFQTAIYPALAAAMLLTGCRVGPKYHVPPATATAPPVSYKESPTEFKDADGWKVAAPQDAVDSILEAYQLRRTELIDPHLAERALLAGELALARWLLVGVRSHDDEVVADAVAMLLDLEEHLRMQDEQESAAEAV